MTNIQISNEEVEALIAESCARMPDLIESGRADDAILLGEQILKVDPNCRDASLCLGLARAHVGKFDEAKLTLLWVAQQNPDDFRVMNNLGLVHAMCGERADALRCFDRAYDLSGEAIAGVNAALELRYAGRQEEAEKRLIELSDKSIHAKFNLASMYHEDLRLDEAEKSYRELLSIEPNYPIAEFNLGALLCLTGRRIEGLSLMEARWRAFNHLQVIRKSIDLPFWDGSKGKNLVIFCDQGVGDFVFFSRYIPLAAKRCNIQIRVGSHLMKLAEFMGPLYKEGGDCCVSVTSLPLFFPDEIPAPMKLGIKDIEIDSTSKKIGLCWCGSPAHKDDSSRSIKLRNFVDMTRIPNTKWYTCGWTYGARRLKNGTVVNWEDGGESAHLIDTGPVQTDLASSAGVIANMDMVITVDTATAHIAGSLGVPTLLMLPYSPDWRWGLTGDTTEWYPSMKIARQHRPGDWSVPLGEAVRMVSELCGE